MRPAVELVAEGTEESGGGWSSAGLYVAEYKWVDRSGVGTAAAAGCGVSIGKWFFMNDLMRGGGRAREFAYLGAVEQSVAEMVCGWKWLSNQWVGRMSCAWKGGKAVRGGRAIRL